MALIRKNRRKQWPDYLMSLDGMIAQDIPVFASCGKCDTVTRLDLEEMKRRNGGNGTLCLINKHGRCKEAECGGKAVFLYRRGEGVPLFNLVDYDMMEEAILAKKGNTNACAGTIHENNHHRKPA